MTDEQLRNDALFLASMAAFDDMLAKGVITVVQHAEIEKLMADKYHPVLSVFPLTY